MTLTVTVSADGVVKEVNSLEELFTEIKQYDPSVYLFIQFVNKVHSETEWYEESVTATVDE